MNDLRFRGASHYSQGFPCCPAQGNHHSRCSRGGVLSDFIKSGVSQGHCLLLTRQGPLPVRAMDMENVFAGLEGALEGDSCTIACRACMVELSVLGTMLGSLTTKEAYLEQLSVVLQGHLLVGKASELQVVAAAADLFYISETCKVNTYAGCHWRGRFIFREGGAGDGLLCHGPPNNCSYMTACRASLVRYAT